MKEGMSMPQIADSGPGGVVVDHAGRRYRLPRRTWNEAIDQAMASGHCDRLTATRFVLNNLERVFRLHEYQEPEG